MAVCETPQWAGNTCPQARLTVVEDPYSSTETTAVISWTLEYVAYGYAASVSGSRPYSVQVGSNVYHGSFNINGIANTTTIRTGTVNVSRKSSDRSITIMVGFEFKLTWSGVYGGLKSGTSSLTIGSKPSYIVSYNANGGTGAPSNQIKQYDTALTISNTHPTRTGYTFQGWSTTSNGAVSYYAGGTYTDNANITLYAVWRIITYTVTYDANSGIGPPASQVKTYGLPLTLTSTIPTKTNYDFLGWATSPHSTTVAYNAGGTYTANANITLYAIWDLAYMRPAIYNFFVNRCDADGNIDDSGEYALISFDWTTTYNYVKCFITVKQDASIQTIVEFDTTGGSYSRVLGTFDTESSYTIVVTLEDKYGSTTASATLSSLRFTIDLLAGGKGVAFGKTAELEDTVEFDFDGKFNKPVYGKALGMDRLPEIPANACLDDYRDPGCYAVYTNINAGTVTTDNGDGDKVTLGSASVPPDGAGRLEVWSATGEGIYSADWSYLRQRYIVYNSPHAVWERDISRDSNDVWYYGKWWRSSLTPDASTKVYHNQRVLWSGASHMNGSQSITLSEAITAQPNGVILVFSRYASETVYDYNFNTFFVSKTQITNHNSAGHTFVMTTDGIFDVMAAKYLYIGDTGISGTNNNTASGTGASGITYDNAQFVLRYVIGV